MEPGGTDSEKRMCCGESPTHIIVYIDVWLLSVGE